MVWVSYACPHRQCGYKCNVADDQRLRVLQSNFEEDGNTGYAVFSCPKCRNDVGQCLHCSYARNFPGTYRSYVQRNKKRLRLSLESHIIEHVAGIP